MGKKKSTLVRVKDDTTKEPETKVEAKHYRNFNVEVLTNGFLVTVGCQRLIFKTLIELANVLKEYWENPRSVEKKYLNCSFRMDSQVPPPTTTSDTTANIDNGAYRGI